VKGLSATRDESLDSTFNDVEPDVDKVIGNEATA